jgi:hypothetical protein
MYTWVNTEESQITERTARSRKMGSSRGRVIRRIWAKKPAPSTRAAS